MSMANFLIAAGTLIFLAGIAKLGSSHNGGLNLKNFGITIGGSTTQENKVGNVAPDIAEPQKIDWSGIAIAALGAITALIGILK